jgi:hypothetical protein
VPGDHAHDGLLAAYPPAAVLVASRGPLGREQQTMQCVNGNVTLLDYFMQGLCHEVLVTIWAGNGVTDAALDAATAECWRVAESIVRTRAERMHPPADAKPIGGAA